MLLVGLPLATQLAGAAAVAGAAVTAAALLLQRGAAPADGAPLAGRVVALDPGHGGFDGGVRAGGLVEKDLNLDLARRLQAAIARRGGRAVLTRSEDVAYAEENRADLDQRLRLAERAGAQALVSLHANSFPDPSQWGAQTFYPPGRPEAQRLALLIQEELVRLEPENYREALPADFYILTRSKEPAVLVEVGFVTNPRDRARLGDPAWRDRLAAAIARGLERWFAGQRPGP